MKKAIIVFILGMPFLSSSQTIQNINKTNGTSTTNNISTIDSIVFPAGGGQMQINLNNATPVIHQIQDIVNVNFSVGLFPAGTVFCNGTPTVVNEIISPATAKIWMDRNLGASQVANIITDALSYGDLYQWGRGSDGHQCRNSAVTNVLSNTNTPGNSSFILSPNLPNDWRVNSNNNLWQGTAGINNPCPSGFRIPTSAEYTAESNSWSTTNPNGAFSSPLRLSLPGVRWYDDGSILSVGTDGKYWCSNTSINTSSSLSLSSPVYINTVNRRAIGYSVRCIKATINGLIDSIDCSSISINNNVVYNFDASGTTATVPYFGGNGGTFLGQTIQSTGVNGLIASFNVGTFSIGPGIIIVNISGTPLTPGTAYFDLNLGGQNCTFAVVVNPSVFCNGNPTPVIEVINPTTGKIWMDRNLGASNVANSSNDATSFGDLYQWGRRSDGHQCRNSPTTNLLCSTIQTTNGSFIKTSITPFDWRSYPTNLPWVTDNPCPTGFRVPTFSELDQERLSWSSNNSTGAFGSALKLPSSGSRDVAGLVNPIGGNFYWSSTNSGTGSSMLQFFSTSSNVLASNRGLGCAVRCIKDINTPSGTITSIDCNTVSNNGFLVVGSILQGVTSLIPYTGGNGGTYFSQIVSSTGVTGLTASLTAGSFANGSGYVNYTITGTPSSSGTASFLISLGGQVCTLTRSVSDAAITTLYCDSASISGTLNSGNAAIGVSFNLPYTGGNGGAYNGQIVTSTGVTGLTATLSPASFAIGSGSLNYIITGTPSAVDTASFALNIGGQSCIIYINVNPAQPPYPAGFVFCNGATAVVDVTNPFTGKIWMDRNLGASQAATSSNDVNAYGDLYQWGRSSDGHQCRNSATTTTLSSTDQPGNSSFIRSPNSFRDWRSPANSNLWQGVSGVNNPCPFGYRMPTAVELDAERTNWSSNSSAGAFASPLKLPKAGYRDCVSGSLSNVGIDGLYWSSTVNSYLSARLEFHTIGASVNTYYRAYGKSVRCIKN
jgi:hypothetical protein